MIPERAPGMAWQIVDGEMVLLNVDGRELLGLNQVGARVWELIDGTRTVAEIAATVAAEFEAPADQVAADVAAFVEQMRAAGALVVREP